MQLTHMLKFGWKTLQFSALIALLLLTVIPILEVAFYRNINPHHSNLMWIRHYQDKEKKPLYDLRQHWVKLEEISSHLILAVRLAEDHQFFEHLGVYFSALGKAFENTLMGEKTAGYSTITQQTAKNLFLYPKKSFFRKGMEVYFALLMELIWGKERILEVYLNIIELGEGVFGIERGAQKWFAKSPKDLFFDESCLLSAILSKPRKLNPVEPNGEVTWRASYIYRRGIKRAMEAKNAPPPHAPMPLFRLI